ncbi:hypothetical protein HK096_007677, partial [Nowakowskiella sp. JEL0078]
MEDISNEIGNRSTDNQNEMSTRIKEETIVESTTHVKQGHISVMERRKMFETGMESKDKLNEVSRSSEKKEINSAEPSVTRPKTPIKESPVESRQQANIYPAESKNKIGEVKNESKSSESKILESVDNKIQSRNEIAKTDEKRIEHQIIHHQQSDSKRKTAEATTRNLKIESNVDLLVNRSEIPIQQQNSEVSKPLEINSNTWITGLVETEKRDSQKQTLSAKELLRNLEYQDEEEVHFKIETRHSKVFEDNFEDVRISNVDNSRYSSHANVPVVENIKLKDVSSTLNNLASRFKKVDSTKIISQTKESGFEEISSSYKIVDQHDASNFEESLSPPSPIEVINRKSWNSVVSHALINAEVESESEVEEISSPNVKSNDIHENLWTSEINDSGKDKDDLDLENDENKSKDIPQPEPEEESEEEFDEIVEVVQYPMYTGFGVVMDSRRVVKRVPRPKKKKNEIVAPVAEIVQPATVEQEKQTQAESEEPQVDPEIP